MTNVSDRLYDIMRSLAFVFSKQLMYRKNRLSFIFSESFKHTSHIFILKDDHSIFHWTRSLNYKPTNTPKKHVGTFVR